MYLGENNHEFLDPNIVNEGKRSCYGPTSGTTLSIFSEDVG